MKRKLLAAVMVLSIIISIIPLGAFHAFAADSFGVYDNTSVYWEYSSGTLTLSGSGTIPNGTRPWTKAGTVTAVNITGNITAIANSAFAEMNSADFTVNITSPLKTIGEKAFYKSTLKAITLPETLTTIKDWAFGYCARLTKVRIPGSVNTWGENVFEKCTALKTVTVAEG